jgi:hypothetical protein
VDTGFLFGRGLLALERTASPMWSSSTVCELLDGIGCAGAADEPATMVPEEGDREDLDDALALPDTDRGAVLATLSGSRGNLIGCRQVGH